MLDKIPTVISFGGSWLTFFCVYATGVSPHVSAIELERLGTAGVLATVFLSAALFCFRMFTKSNEARIKEKDDRIKILEDTIRDLQQSNKEKSEIINTHFTHHNIAKENGHEN